MRFSSSGAAPTGQVKYSQEIKSLTSGRAYSLKTIAAHWGNIIEGKSVKQQDAVSLELDNVEMITGPGKNLQQTYLNHYAHPFGKFTSEYNAV